MVPDGWRVKKFSDVAVLKSGGTPSKDNPDYWAGDLPWISAASMHDIFVYDSDLRITEEGLAKGSRRAKKDSILLLVRGSMLWKHIPVCLTKRDVAFNQDVKNIVTNNKVTTSFLFYNLKSQENRLLHLVVGTGIGAGKLDTDDLSSLNIYTPPLPEQKKIAAILSTWDDSIAANEDLLANSRLRKKALMQQLLTGKKRLPGFEGEWKTKPISDCGKVYSGGTPDTAIPEYWDGGINWLTPTDVTALRGRYTHQTVRQISESGLKHSSAKLLPPGSVMVCTRATVGEVAMAAEPICTNQGFKSIVPNEESSSEFLYYLLTSSKRRLLRLSSGSTFLELSKGDFDSLDFAMPSIDEQRAIAAVLTTADEEIETLEQRINNLKLQKKALMQQLLTGKKRVKVEPVTA